MLDVTKGLVLRETAVGERDKLLTVLTNDLGVITVSAKGVRSIKNPNASSTQLFCYSNFVLYKKGDYYWLRESDLIDNFYGLRTDLESYALAAYLCSIAEDFACAEEDREQIARLTLNALYAIAGRLAPLPLIKGAYEMRVAADSGFQPNLVACSCCAAFDDVYFVFDIMNGELLCSKCEKERRRAALDIRSLDEQDSYQSLEPVIRMRVCSGTLAALRYVVYGRRERLFSFALSPEAVGEFSAVCENYLLHHIGRGFQTLDFYKSITEGVLPKQP